MKIGKLTQVSLVVNPINTSVNTPKKIPQVIDYAGSAIFFGGATSPNDFRYDPAEILLQ